MKIFKNNNKVLLHNNKALIAPDTQYAIKRELDNNILQYPTNNFIFKLPEGITKIDTYSLCGAFNSCTTITEVDFNNPNTEISFGSYALYYAFSGCTNLTTISNLKLSANLNSSTCLREAFSKTNIGSINFLSNLKTISGDFAMQQCFSDCNNLTGIINFSNLETVSSWLALTRTFNSTSITSVNFPVLNTLTGGRSMEACFNKCKSLTSVSFPALKSTSFGAYTSQFNNMLSNVTGCTVHFPSNLQSIIGSWTSVTAGFGGTNTTVLFDLPATE